MKANKLFFLLILLLATHCMFADIALPKVISSPNTTTITKYYFGNVDSFSNYKFFIKNLESNKTFKVKQNATFSIIPDENKKNNKLEIWAINKNTNEMTNTFILSSIISKESFEGNTAHTAITFYFDKKNKLAYKQTIMKPDCYNKRKKNLIPVFTFNKTINTSQLIYISFFSLLSLFSILILQRLISRKVYA